MKITAQEEYGLRCLVAVARLVEMNRPVTITEIAASEGLSVQYVAKLLNVLRRHELVESSRGTCGGFRLTRPAHKIAVIEVLRALGSGFEVGHKALCNDFVGQRAQCVHLGQCSMRPMWHLIVRHITEFLQHLSLADLLSEEAAAGRRMEQYLQTVVEKLPIRKGA